jgi:hypothetical protein
MGQRLSSPLRAGKAESTRVDSATLFKLWGRGGVAPERTRARSRTEEAAAIRGGAVI